MNKQEERQAYYKIRSLYGRSSKVTYAHIMHRANDEYNAKCEFCVKEANCSPAQRERQERRVNGRYEEYYLCDGCEKKVSHSAATAIEADFAILEFCVDCAKRYEEEGKLW